MRADVAFASVDPAIPIKHNHWIANGVYDGMREGTCILDSVKPFDKHIGLHATVMKANRLPARNSANTTECCIAR